MGKGFFYVILENCGNKLEESEVYTSKFDASISARERIKDIVRKKVYGIDNQDCIDYEIEECWFNGNVIPNDDED